MCFNEGPLDQALRFSVGVAVIITGVILDNYLISAVGLVPLVTGIVGFCPLYTLLKINTGCQKA